MSNASQFSMGLGKRFNPLVDEYPETFDMIAEAAKYSPGPVSASSARFCRNW